MALPLDIRDLMSSGARLREERDRVVRIAVFVDAEAPGELVAALKEAVRPHLTTALLHVEAVVPGDVLGVESSADAVIGVTGSGDTLSPSLARARAQAIPTALVTMGESRDDAARRLEHPALDVIAEDDPDATMRALGRWLADRIESKRVSLAANFPFVRRAVAEEAVRTTAFQNAVIGGVAIIPGADMPLMTANQAKMVMQIAAAYGEPLGAERVKELAVVIGGAFTLRTVARQLVGLVPGFGWALKAGIGYSGTLAMGYAAVEYFEGGGDVRGLGAKVREARDRAIAAASRRGRGTREPEPIPAHWAEDAHTGTAPVLPDVGVEAGTIAPESMPR